LSGIIGLLAVDAETTADKMTMAGHLLASAIRLYQKCDMELDEIDEVFQQAVPEFRKIHEKKKK
jgi:hypothetical protein